MITSPFERSEKIIVQQLLKWLSTNEPVYLATVAKTWGSSPRPTGSMMGISNNGNFIGSVSGGCVEEEIIELIKLNKVKGYCEIVFDSQGNRKLPCGGNISIIIEVFRSPKFLQKFLSALESDFEKVRKTIDLSKASSVVEVLNKNNTLIASDKSYIFDYHKQWTIIIIGTGELAQAVCSFSKLLDYDVVVCDPRKEFRESWSIQDVKVDDSFPDDFIRGINCDSSCAILTLTHDPKVDDLALIEALDTKAFYIGALGSSKTTENRNQRLIQHFNIPQECIDKISAPVGVDLNTKKPSEIALSILAEITAVKNHIQLSSRRILNES